MSTPAIDIGIAEPQRQAIADGLSHLLADNATLYFKTHGFHWNVTGPMFQTLHLMFEQQYNEMWVAMDEIAERIRALGSYAAVSWSEIARAASVEEATGVPSAEQMIRQLVVGHETLIRTARGLIPLASEVGDEVTCSPSACRSTRRPPGCSAACSPDPSPPGSRVACKARARRPLSRRSTAGTSGGAGGGERGAVVGLSGAPAGVR